MSTSFGWDKVEAGIWFIPLADERGVCRQNCARDPLRTRAPYLSALEVCLRQGAIQIHVYLTLPKLPYKLPPP